MPDMTPVERYADRRRTWDAMQAQYVQVRAAVELYDYAVQLEHENKLSDERARIWERKTCEAWRDNKALSVNAENLEIVRKQRDEARDIARSLLAVAKDLHDGESSMGRMRTRSSWYVLPEWLRKEVEG